ncbi:MAG: monovalent cation/H(+) antiporter subunit G [Desulfobacterales bacterium]|nr:monovalent cation/H(+) antiporter subunit G [Desulfobacterales bacterium]
MSAVLAAVLMVVGALFALVAAVGVVRLPDLLVRMHAATKAGTLGAGLILLSVAIHGMETGLTLRALAAVCFLLLTAPVSAHLIGRAAYRVGIQLWDRTEVDELEQYCRESGLCETWKADRGLYEKGEK